ASTALMIRRVYAIYGHNKRLLIALLGYLVAGIAVSAVSRSSTESYQSNLPIDQLTNASPVYIVSLARRSFRRSTHVFAGMSAVWIILMVFDLIVFVLTAFKTMEAVREPKMALSRVLLRDGALHAYILGTPMAPSSVLKLIPFRFMVLLNAANVVTYYVSA
ncbi:hypothetical protein EV715DRAFT_201340, partial [Schizophyllum commune]